MPEDATGISGMERVTRAAQARRGAAGPNTEFIDYFNADLMPGIEMSGGFGLFHPQGRLPAHVHDFDESISHHQRPGHLRRRGPASRTGRRGHGVATAGPRPLLYQ